MLGRSAPACQHPDASPRRRHAEITSVVRCRRGVGVGAASVSARRRCRRGVGVGAASVSSRCRRGVPRSADAGQVSASLPLAAPRRVSALTRSSAPRHAGIGQRHAGITSDVGVADVMSACRHRVGAASASACRHPVGVASVGVPASRPNRTRLRADVEHAARHWHPAGPEDSDDGDSHPVGTQCLPTTDTGRLSPPWALKPAGADSE
jgi:hypothetical protein